MSVRKTFLVDVAGPVADAFLNWAPEPQALDTSSSQLHAAVRHK